MEREILSLKNIYKILTANDYPVYSEKVIRKEKHKGFSNLRFWQEILIPEWKNTPTGQKIWRVEGGRNRYTSEVINRSESYHLYGRYLKEIADRFQKETLYHQVTAFVKMLEEREYDYKTLIHRIAASVECYAVTDPAFDEERKQYFSSLLKERAYFERLGVYGRLFFSGYLLTMMMLHGLGVHAEERHLLLGMIHKSGCEIKSFYYYAYMKSERQENMEPPKILGGGYRKSKKRSLKSGLEIVLVSWQAVIDN